MWETYLDEASSRIVNKYHARRVQAQLRQELLAIRAELVGAGVSAEAAMSLAMQRLGDPAVLAEQVAVSDRQQRGWLFLFSLAELVFGIGIMLVSVRTEFLAAMALGRIVALWGFVSTAIHSVNQNGLRQNLLLLRRRWRLWIGAIAFRDVWRMTATGAVSGVLAALLGALPWSVVNARMFHPVMTTEALSAMLVAAAVWGPWVLVRRRIGPAFFSVTLQAWASFSVTVAYVALISWRAGLVPPPLFNWDPALFVTGSWMFSFVSLRALTFLFAIRERFPWADQRIGV
ncbi:MAG: hypothetical protein M0Z53_07340 [Thermaerobacter sp.]|nr:hypothetical protein [Thermaerobacter sp.]